MSDILLTGSKGFIAKNIKNYFETQNIVTDELNRSILDLTDRNALSKFLEGKKYKMLVHCASVGGNRTKIDDNSLKNNLSMFYNLLQHIDKFDKFINFGSGAELDRSLNINLMSNTKSSFPIDEYGLAKNIINRIGETYNNFYSLRIFNVFNHNELDTRMIKSNITKYINKNNMIIHQNKLMDFFYINDLLSILNYYLNNDKCPKNLNCCYETKYSLYEIAKLINNLDDYNVDICIENNDLGFSYIGDYNLNLIKINLIGLENGIKNCYEFLKEQK